MPDANEEATNAERAGRIDKLMDAHDAILGDAILGDPADEERDYYKAADLIADIMHWCNANGHDFDEALRLGQVHFAQEQLGQ